LPDLVKTPAVIPGDTLFHGKPEAASYPSG